MPLIFTSTLVLKCKIGKGVILFCIPKLLKLPLLHQKAIENVLANVNLQPQV